MLESITQVLENKYKIVVPLFGAAYAAPNKGTTNFYWFKFLKTVLNPPVNGEIQGLFKTFECFSSTFQGKFNFQGLFKTVLYIQVLFKPVRTLASLIKCVRLKFTAYINKKLTCEWLYKGIEKHRSSQMNFDRSAVSLKPYMDYVDIINRI